jgi:ABC-type Zn uptake system ZnuABC Zn-binding protein ZnuA
VSAAPVLKVATGLYPLARMAALVGGAKATVTDVVPAGADPFTYRLPAPAAAEVHQAGLAVEVGGRIQPSFEAAAAGARAVASLGSRAGGSGGYVWLDPTSMGRAVASLAAAMERADPAAGPLYRRNLSSLQARIASLGGDYSSTLGTCPNPVLVTPDDALDATAASYGIKVVVAGPRPSPAAVAAAVADLRAAGTGAVLTEPWVDNAGVDAVASAGSAALHAFDTLAGPPPGGWPRGAGYFALMEQNLGTLSGALGCGGGTQ